MTDDGRIRASLPTAAATSPDAGARVDRDWPTSAGRRASTRTRCTRWRPVVDRLDVLLDGVTVSPFAGDVVGPDSASGHGRAGSGTASLTVLENVRFEAGRDEQGRRRAGRLRRCPGRPGRRSAELYVDDAFGAVHRKHASVYDLAQAPAGVRGRSCWSRRRWRVLDRLTGQDGERRRPYAVVLGGSARSADKLGRDRGSLLPKVDTAAGRRRHVLHLPRSARVFEVGDVAAWRPTRSTACREFLARDRRPDRCCRSTWSSAEATSAPTSRPTPWSTVDADPGRDRMGLDLGPVTVGHVVRQAPSAGRPARSSGTGRWGCSSWPRTPSRHPRASPRQSPSAAGRADRGRGWRQRPRPSGQLGHRGGPLHPPVHRRRRIAGEAGGQAPCPGVAVLED